MFADLKQELKVIDKPHKKEDEITNENPVVNGHISSSRTVEIETQTPLLSPQKREITGFIEINHTVKFIQSNCMSVYCFYTI